MTLKFLVSIISVAFFIETDMVKGSDNFLEKYNKYDRICNGMGYQGKGCSKEKSIVAFNARLPSILQNTPANTVVVFGKVTFNVGNAYDPQTGKFTAPTEGIYSFTWTILTHPGKSFRSLLVHNSTTVGYNHAYGISNDNFSSGSTTCIIKMKKNDKVWVSTYSKESYAYANWSSFSGFQL